MINQQGKPITCFKCALSILLSKVKIQNNEKINYAFHCLPKSPQNHPSQITNFGELVDSILVRFKWNNFTGTLVPSTAKCLLAEGLAGLFDGLHNWICGVNSAFIYLHLSSRKSHLPSPKLHCYDLPSIFVNRFAMLKCDKQHYQNYQHEHPHKDHLQKGLI